MLERRPHSDSSTSTKHKCPPTISVSINKTVNARGVHGTSQRSTNEKFPFMSAQFFFPSISVRGLNFSHDFILNYFSYKNNEEQCELLLRGTLPQSIIYTLISYVSMYTNYLPNLGGGLTTKQMMTAGHR